LASVCLGRTIKLWDLTTEQELWTLPQTGDVVFDRAGQRLAVPQLQYLEAVEAVTGRELLRVERHSWNCVAVAFSPDGQRLVTASGDHTVKVWDATTGQEALTLYGHQDEVYMASFTPDGQRIVSEQVRRHAAYLGGTSRGGRRPRAGPHPERVQRPGA